jgi:hypothetical protein
MKYIMNCLTSKRFLLVSILFFILIIKASCQTLAEDYWHDQAFIITENDERISGKIKYDMSKEIVIMQTSTNSQTYSSRNLKSFSFFDRKGNRVRNFVVVPFPKNQSGYEVPSFFELLNDGKKATLLTREYLTSQLNNNNMGYGRYGYSPYGYNPYGYGTGGYYMTYQVKYDFFILKKGNKLKAFKGNKKDIAKILDDNNGKISEYIKKNKLKTNNQYDLIKIFDFYNQN